MASTFHLADLFETVAATLPDRVAVISDSLSLTFSELNGRANRVAFGLANHGIKRGDTVGIYMLNRAEHIEAFIAIIKMGAIPFNVNYRYTSDELRYLLVTAKAACVIHDPEFADTLAQASKGLSDLKLCVSVDNGKEACAKGGLRYSDLLQSETKGSWIRDESDLILTFTGGTTGFPKGVMWPHKAFLFACAGGAGMFNPAGPIVEPADIADRAARGYPLRVFPIAPLMHGAALWTLWSSLLNGITIVLDESGKFDADAIWDRIVKYDVNIIQIVGDAMAIPLRDALKENPSRWDLSKIFNFGSGGAVFSQQVKDDIRVFLPPTAGITDGLGSSETGISGLAAASSEGLMSLPSDENQKVVVGDRFAEIGETGLIARSGHIPVGYYGDPEKSAEVFRMLDGRLWAISGDSGRLDNDKNITVFGRGSTCINSGGEKIFPEEIETALRSHPAINDAVVAGRKDERWGEIVVGIISLKPGNEKPDEAQIREHLIGQLARYKIPKALIWAEEIPRSPAGKQNYRWAKEVAA